MSNEQFQETGVDLYQEGCQARIQNALFHAVKPRPWKLGWQDTNEQMLPAGISAIAKMALRKPSVLQLGYGLWIGKRMSTIVMVVSELTIKQR